MYKEIVRDRVCWEPVEEVGSCVDIRYASTDPSNLLGGISEIPWRPSVCGAEYSFEGCEYIGEVEEVYSL